MKSRLFLLILFIFLVCSSNEKWEGKIEKRGDITYIRNPSKGLWGQKKKLVLKKVLSIGGENTETDYILAKPSDVKVGKSGNIYIVDFQDNCVKIFNQHGKYIKRIGSQGGGPGELYGPAQIELDEEDNIYIYEAGNRRISIFSSTGNFIDSFQYKEFESLRTLIALDDFLFIAGNNRMKPLNHLIFQYNKNGKLIHAFGKPFKKGKGFFGDEFSTPKISKTPNNKILCGLEYPYEIRKFDLKGKLISVITRNDPIFPEPKKTSMPAGTFALMSRCYISDIIVFPKGKFFVKIMDRGKDYIEGYKNSKLDLSKPYSGLQLNWSRRYDLYNSKGIFLQTFTLDKKYGRIDYIDDKGYVYTVSDPDQIPRVCKYSISFKDLKK